MKILEDEKIIIHGEGEGYWIEEGKRFLIDSTPHLNSLKSMAISYGGEVLLEDGILKLRGIQLMSMTDVEIAWSYEVYRILNIAFQGIGWFEKVNYFYRILQRDSELQEEDLNRLRELFPTMSETEGNSLFTLIFQKAMKEKEDA